MSSIYNHCSQVVSTTLSSTKTYISEKATQTYTSAMNGISSAYNTIGSRENLKRLGIFIGVSSIAAIAVVNNNEIAFVVAEAANNTALPILANGPQLQNIPEEEHCHPVE